MTVSVQSKNNKAYAVINYKVNGERKNKWVSLNMPYTNHIKEAKAKANEILLNFNKSSLYNKSSEILFVDYLDDWLKNKEYKIAETTYQAYQIYFSRHIKPYFEKLNLTLNDITRKDIQDFIDYQALYGSSKGSKLSLSQLKQYKLLIHQSLDRAVLDNLIPSNPCNNIELPKKVQRNMKVYSVDTINKFLDAIKDEETYPIFLTTFLYGLRLGEVIGLKWDSVDFVNNKFTINHTISRVTTIIEKDITKNKSSHRSFDFNSQYKQILLKVKDKQDYYKKLYGNTYNNSGYVFTKPNGNFYRPEFINNKFHELQDKHGFPRIRFHDIRHSCASMLVSQNLDLKKVQQYMGHANISTTGDIYVHLSTNDKKDTEKLVGSLITF